MGMESLGVMSLIGGALSSGINGIVANEMSNKQYTQSKKLMSYQDELQGERFDKQFNLLANYNSPSAQISRMREAGLNPLHTSEFGGEFSPTSPSVSGGSAEQYAPNLDLGSIVSNLLQSIYNQKSLQLEERKVKATESKTDADISNNTNMTASEIAVNSQKVENMISEKNQTDEQINKIKEDTAAIKASVDVLYKNLRLKMQEVAQGWAKTAIEKFNSDWQQQVANFNAKTDRMNAVTSRDNAVLARDTFNWNKTKWEKEFKFEKQKFSHLVNNDNIDNFMRIVEKSSTNIFGINYTSAKDIFKMFNLTSAYVDGMNNLSPANVSKTAPKISSIMEQLQQFKPSAPFNVSKGNYYTQPFDASDSF